MKPIKDKDFFRTHRWVKDEMGSEFIIEVDKYTEFLNAQKDKVPDENAQEEIDEIEEIDDLDAILENGTDGVPSPESAYNQRQEVITFHEVSEFNATPRLLLAIAPVLIGVIMLYVGLVLSKSHFWVGLLNEFYQGRDEAIAYGDVVFVGSLIVGVAIFIYAFFNARGDT